MKLAGKTLAIIAGVCVAFVCVVSVGFAANWFENATEEVKADVINKFSNAAQDFADAADEAVEEGKEAALVAAAEAAADAAQATAEAEDAADGVDVDGSGSDAGESAADGTSGSGGSGTSGTSGGSGNSGSSGSGSGGSSSGSGGSGDSGSSAPAESTQPSTVTVSVAIDASRGGGGYSSTTVTLNSGSSVYNALVATGASVGGSSSYVSSINGLAEFAKGQGSGWLYFVNGSSPSYSCGSYILYGGEQIKWVYTTDYGNDV